MTFLLAFALGAWFWDGYRVMLRWVGAFVTAEALYAVGTVWLIAWIASCVVWLVIVPCYVPWFADNPPSGYGCSAAFALITPWRARREWRRRVDFARREFAYRSRPTSSSEVRFWKLIEAKHSSDPSYRYQVLYNDREIELLAILDGWLGRRSLLLWRWKDPPPRRGRGARRRVRAPRLWRGLSCERT